MADVTLDIDADDETEAGLGSVRRSLTSFGKAAVGMFTGIGAAMAANFTLGKVTEFFAGAVSAAREGEMAERRLQAALEATGRTSGYTREQLSTIASGLEDLTGVSDEAIMGVQTLLTQFKNVRGDTFRETTALALDMAAVMGTDASSAAARLGKALNDPLRGMQQLAEAGIVFTEEERKSVEQMMKAGDVAAAQGVILEKVRGQVGGAAEEMMTPWQKVQVTIGRLQEEIGGALTPVIDDLMEQAVELAPLLRAGTMAFVEIAKSTVEWAGGLTKHVKPALDWFMGATADTMAFFETLWEQPGDVLEAAGTTIALWLETMAADAEHQLTEVIPTYVQWFVDNLGNMLEDAANYEMTVLGNMWKNIEDFFSNVMKWLSGDEVSFEWTGLTEGFESTLSELPEIAARTRTPMEQALQQNLDAVNARLGKGFQQRADEYRKAIKDMLGGTDVAVDPADLTPTDTGEGFDVGKEPKDEKSKVGEMVALTELASKISAASAKDPVDKVKDAVNETSREDVETQEKVGRELKDRLDKGNALTEELRDLVKSGAQLAMGP